MTTIDLTVPVTDGHVPASPGSAGPGSLADVPHRLTLTVAELRHAAGLAGDVPLPFTVTDPAGRATGRLDQRLGGGQGSPAEAAYADVVASLRDPGSSLQQRGLVTDGALDAGIAGALGLLAAPELALDLDVTVGGDQARVWQRQARDAVATLATADGLVFELAWFATEHWSTELARVAALPEDEPLSVSQVRELDADYVVLDAVGEAVRSGRHDLVPVVLAEQEGAATDPQGEPLTPEETATAASALHQEGRGRLRGLVSGLTSAEHAQPGVGVVSWVLVADGWRSLHPHPDHDGVVMLRRVAPEDLAALVAPVLAEVTA